MGRWRFLIPVPIHVSAPRFQPLRSKRRPAIDSRPPGLSALTCCKSCGAWNEKLENCFDNSSHGYIVPIGVSTPAQRRLKPSRPPSFRLKTFKNRRGHAQRSTPCSHQPTLTTHHMAKWCPSAVSTPAQRRLKASRPPSSRLKTFKNPRGHAQRSTHVTPCSHQLTLTSHHIAK